MPTAFYFYLNSEARRSVVNGEVQCPGMNYMLYGADLLPSHGIMVHHNLEKRGASSRRVLWLAWLISRGVALSGGSGGDFQTVLQERRRANRENVIISTVDNVGVPLAYLNALGLITPPLVYISIGIPERIRAIKSELTRAFYRVLYRRIPCFVAYGWQETVWLRQWLGFPPDSPRVVFIPFGVDHRAFTPRPDAQFETDVLSIGADMQRDFGLLIDTAKATSSISYRIITSSRHAATFRTTPPNVQILTDVPFAEIHRQLAATRLVALPCHENTYSAGTTTLLQAMAMAKPIVVTRTGAISHGYQLEDNVNCRLVTPGSQSEWGHAIQSLLDDPVGQHRLGEAARKTVESHLTWDHYVNRLSDVITKMNQPNKKISKTNENRDL